MKNIYFVDKTVLSQDIVHIFLYIFNVGFIDGWGASPIFFPK